MMFRQKLTRSQVLAIFWAVSVTALASDCDRMIRAARKFRPQAEPLETREIPGIIIPGNPGNLPGIPVGYTGRGGIVPVYHPPVYSPGFPGGVGHPSGGSSSSSGSYHPAPVPYIDQVAAQVVREDHIHQTNAVPLIVSGAQHLKPELASALQAQGISRGAGVITTIAAKIAGGVLKVERQHFRPNLLRLTSLLLTPGQGHGQLSYEATVVHGADEFAVQGKLPPHLAGPLPVEVSLME